ncbi:hypothetical protein JCM8208_004802, partial [Rhodotorula glutinis]
WFEIKNISEGVASVEALPKEYRGLLVTAIAEAALTKKADAVNLTKDLFWSIVAQDVVGRSTLLEAFAPVMKTLPDVAIDAPGAFNFVVVLLLGIPVTKDELDELANKMESEEGEEEVEYAKENLTKAWEKATA